MKLKYTILSLVLIALTALAFGQVQSTSATYSLGNIQSDRAFGHPSQSSACPGTLIVNIPVGATITSVNVAYSYEALPGSFRAFQVSELRCTSPGGLPEGVLATNSNYSPGVQTYSRTGLTIANGVIGGGNITFQLHAGVTFGSQVGCSEQYQRVNNNTWVVTVNYLPPATPTAPTNPNPANDATNVSVNIGQLTWTFGSFTSFYDLYFGTVNPPTNKVVNNQVAGATGAYSTGTLLSGTNYYWKVVERNSSGIEFVGPIWNFSTECAPAGVPIMVNFDDLVVPGAGSGNPPPNILPLCWTMQYQCSISYAAQGVYSSPYAFTQPNCWVFSNEGDGSAYNIMIMPEMAAPLSTLALSFIAKANNLASTLAIGTMTDKNNPLTFTELTTINLNTLFNQFDIPYSSYTGTDKFMAVKFTSPGPNNYSYIYLDNVLISEIPACPRPRDLKALEVTSSTAKVTWLEQGSATQWNIEVVPTNTAPTGNYTPISTNPYIFTGLQPNTTYDFYIQSDCGSGSISYWSNKGTFKTACNPNNIPIFENFDAGNTLPACWSVSKTPIGGSWSIQQYSGYSLPNCFAMYTNNTNDVVILVSPPIGLPDGSLQDIQLNFYAKRSGFENYVTVGTMSNPLDYNTFTPYKTITLTNAFAGYEVWFNDYTGTDNYIAFKCGFISQTSTINLDNINFAPLPYCLNPVNLFVDDIHENNARLHWTESHEATQWQIEIGAAGFVPGTNTYTQTYTYSLIGTDYSYVMTGLQPGLFYDVYIRALCGNGDVSLWSPKNRFMSQPILYTPLPFNETFDPGFTYTVNSPSNNVNWTLFSTLYHSAPNSTRNPYGSSNNNVMLISRRFDLTGKTNAYLSFWHIAKTDGERDHCYVEISTDGGANFDQIPVSAYVGLGKYYQPTQNLPEGPCFDEDSYPEWGTGSETPNNTWWKNENFDLSAYTNSNNVVVRFRIFTDNATNRYGWLIDDVSIQAYSGPETAVSPSSFDVEVMPNQSASETLTISNNGDFPIAFTANVQNFADNMTTIMSQDFEVDTVPPGWVVINGIKSSPASMWRIEDNTPNNLNGTKYMYVDRTYPDTCTESLISPAFNGAGYANVFLTFDQCYVKSSSNPANNYAQVFVWDGAVWQLVLDMRNSNVGVWGNPDKPVIDITQYVNPAMKVKFYYVGFFTAKWGVDNVKITASDIPLNWLTLDTKTTISGLIQGGQSQNINVGFLNRPTFPNGIWRSEIQIVSNDQAHSPVIIPVSFTIGCVQPWQFVQTGFVHNISIPVGVSPEIAGVPLADQDWIGVFYIGDDGEEACGGALQWNGAGGLVMNACGDDPLTQQKDGFAPGEVFRWRLKKCGDPVQYSAKATYDQNMPNTGYFGDFGLSKLTSLTAAHIQYYTFKEGWNSMSGYVIPTDPAVENMFAPIVNNLTILRNLSLMYWPAEGINTIGNWDNYSGYVLKTTADTDFDISGTTYANSSLSLQPGWQYLPVLSRCPVNVAQLFAGNLNNMIIVQDLIGTKVFWPQMQVYTLSTLEPGKAYKVKMSDGVNVSFPACQGKGGSQILPDENILKTHWGNISMTPVSQVALFMPEALVNINEGDVIGAVDRNGNIFGYCEVSDKVQSQVITLFGDDNTSSDKTGFEPFESVYFMLYRPSTNEEFSLEVTYNDILENTTGTFIAGSFSAISEMKMSSTGIGEQPAGGIRIYPNPASEILNITGVDTKTEIWIYNIFGEQVYFIELNDSSAIDVGNLAKGTYIVKLVQDQNTTFTKLVIR